MLVLPQLALADGPGISNVSVTDITTTTATITWTTNTTSDSRVNYGTTTTLGNTASDSAKVTNHNIVLAGLNSNTVYYFEVESTDSSGTATDNNGGAYYSFATLVGYSITLDPVSGVYGDLIEATVAVAAADTYCVCWDSLKASGILKWGGANLTFTATTAGSRAFMFSVPEATKGTHKVYLATDTYANKAEATFEVYPTVKIEEVVPEGEEDEEPMVGPVGTEVTIGCYGFGASQDVQVKFHGKVVKTDKTDTKGSWEVTYNIPATPGGDRIFEVEAKGEDDEWIHRGGKHFTVTPEITAPSSGAVAQTIEIKGTGFASEEDDIEITFSNHDVEVVVKENILAYVNGSWNASINIPVLKGGTYTMDASGELTRARDVPDVKFSVGAGIFVEPPGSYYVGETINVAGGGFAGDETGINVKFDGAVVATGITAKGDGAWESSFVLPPSTFGNHTVEASGGRTSAVTTTLITKDKIEKLSPTEGAPGDSVSLTGSGFHGNQQLTVTVGGVEVTENLQTQPNGNVVINFHVPKGSLEGTQKLVVTDEGGATASVNFTVTKKILSTTPLPISPKDSTLRSGEVTFRWLGVTNSTGYTYTLEINKNTTSGNIWSKSGIVESSYTMTNTVTTKETLDEPGTYYWRVKIVDEYGNEGPWSGYTKFKVAPIPTLVWVVVGVVVLVGLMIVAYRETKFKVTE